MDGCAAGLDHLTQFLSQRICDTMSKYGATISLKVCHDVPEI